MKLKNALYSLIILVACTACGSEPKADADKEKEPPKETATEKNKETQKPKELSEDGKKLVKKWLLKSFTHSDGKVQEVKESSLNLSADGTFDEVRNKKSIATGTWNVEKNELVMAHLTGDMKDQTEKSTIKESSDKKLILNEKGVIETYQAE